MGRLTFEQHIRKLFVTHELIAEENKILLIENATSTRLPNTPSLPKQQSSSTIRIVLKVKTDTRCFYVKLCTTDDMHIMDVNDRINKIHINGEYLTKPLFYGKLTEEYYYLIFPEATQGDLVKFMENNNLTPRRKLLIFEKICLGVKTLHQNNIVHGDLKLENVLIFEENGEIIVKLADFDGATIFNHYDSSASVPRQYSKYTRAPESFCNDSLKCTQIPLIDMFSLGCILLELFRTKEERIIFAELKSHQDVEKSIKESLIDNELTMNLITVLVKLINLESDERLKMEDLLANIASLLKIERDYLSSNEINSLFQNLLDNTESFSNIDAIDQQEQTDHSFIIGCKLLSKLFDEELMLHSENDLVVELSKKYFNEKSHEVLKTYTNCFTVQGVILESINDIEGQLKLENAIEKILEMIVNPNWGIKEILIKLLVTSISQRSLSFPNFRKVLESIIQKLNDSSSSIEPFHYLSSPRKFPDYWNLLRENEEYKKRTLNSLSL